MFIYLLTFLCLVRFGLMKFFFSLHTTDVLNIDFGQYDLNTNLIRRQVRKCVDSSLYRIATHKYDLDIKYHYKSTEFLSKLSFINKRKIKPR